MDQTIKLNCQIQKHNNKQIQAICSNKNCNYFKPSCIQCILEIHHQHAPDMIELFDLGKYFSNQFSQSITISKQVSEKYTTLYKMIKNRFEISQQNLLQLGLNDLNKEVKVLLKYTNITQEINDYLQQCNVIIDFIYELLNNVKQEILIENSNNQVQLQDIKQIKIRQISDQQQQQSQEFKFSKKWGDDDNSVEFQKNNTQIIAKSGNIQCFPSIKKNTIVKFGFKITKEKYFLIDWIGVGVVHTNIRQVNIDLNQLNHQTYLICSTGFVYSHQDEKINNKVQNYFNFNNEDIVIIIEVNQHAKYIKWTKEFSDQTYIMNINTNEDLSPFVMCGNGQFTIQIINY